LIEGRIAEPEERIRSAILLQKQAQAAGWDTRIGYAQAQDDSRTYKTGPKAGETVDGKIIDMVWLQGLREGKVFTVTWMNNKLDNVIFNREISSLKDLKEKLNE
jgi:hypothetical protein